MSAMFQLKEAKKDLQHLCRRCGESILKGEKYTVTWPHGHYSCQHWDCDDKRKDKGQ